MSQVVRVHDSIAEHIKKVQEKMQCSSSMASMLVFRARISAETRGRPRKIKFSEFLAMPMEDFHVTISYRPNGRGRV